MRARRRQRDVDGGRRGRRRESQDRLSREIDERRGDPSTDERGKRPLAGNGRPRARDEEAHRAAVCVGRRIERGHNDDGNRTTDGGCGCRSEGGGQKGEYERRDEARAASLDGAPRPGLVREHARIVLAPLTASPSDRCPIDTVSLAHVSRELELDQSRRHLAGRLGPASERARRCSPAARRRSSRTRPRSPSGRSRGLGRSLDPVRLEDVGCCRHRRCAEAEQSVRTRRDSRRALPFLSSGSHRRYSGRSR